MANFAKKKKLKKRPGQEKDNFNKLDRLICLGIHIFFGTAVTWDVRHGESYDLGRPST